MRYGYYFKLDGRWNTHSLNDFPPETTECYFYSGGDIEPRWSHSITKMYLSDNTSNAGRCSFTKWKYINPSDEELTIFMLIS